MKLSVVTIVKNEEKIIEKFLDQLNWVDEIVIVDNGSIDNTVTLAKKYTSNVYTFSQKHFGKLKQFALSKATGDWTLVLDADEFISKNLENEIRNVLKLKSKYIGYQILRVGYFLNHRLYARGFREYKVRLCKQGSGVITQVPIHEELIVRGKIGRLDGEIRHYSYRSLHQTIVKLTSYACSESTLSSSEKIRVGIKNFTLYPLHMFWTIFVDDKGYKDGIWGIGLALCFAYYEFARYYFLLKHKFLSNPTQ